MDKYFYSIELDENCKKLVHIFGNVFLNDADETKVNNRIAEFKFLYFSIEELIEMLKTDTFYEYLCENVDTLGNLTKEAAEIVCGTYFNEKTSGFKKSFLDLTKDTPSGDYYSE